MFDLAIIGGTLIDPVTRRLIPANVYLKEGKVAEVSRQAYEAKETVDACGMYVSPGFIDIHGHIDGNRAMGELLARQGVTTVINGNCGFGQKDFPAYFDKLEKSGFVLNQSQLAGGTTVRERAGQPDGDAPLTEEQMVKAEQILLEDLEAGASGLGFGIEYAQGTTTEEMVRLSRVAARYGKPVSIHVRTDCWAGLAGLKEAIDLSRKTGVGVIISHVVYQFGFGMMAQALQMIEDAVAEGLDISCDSGMYTSFVTIFQTPVFDESFKERWDCGYDSIYMVSGKYAGQYLTKETYRDAWDSGTSDLALALIGKPHEIFMAYDLPYMMCSSDAGISGLIGIEEVIHPQDTTTFPKFIREVVVENGQLTLVDAISRITSIPAERMGLDQKGRLTPGMDADVVVFDLEKLRGRGEFAHIGNPAATPEGIKAVIVNGKIAIRDDKIECTTAGKVLRAPNIPWKL
ncbi:MAG: amidohydrolase family protein [Oscillospiraceae bacterium]|nr:amidohydrolase family protein [Oscillospiraceae bacterium]